MEFLSGVFDLWLLMLEALVDDTTIGMIFWIFILVIVALILLKIWRGVKSWTQS